MKLDCMAVKKEELILNSFHYGEISYLEKEILHFEKGMLGFEELKKFILREVDNNKSFKLLHSIENVKIAFVVLNPFDFVQNYEINLDDEVIKRLDIENEKDVMLLNTVTLSSDAKKITTNLRAPIVMNVVNNKSEQVILNTEKYAIKHKLVEEK